MKSVRSDALREIPIFLQIGSICFPNTSSTLMLDVILAKDKSGVLTCSFSAAPIDG